MTFEYMPSNVKPILPLERCPRVLSLSSGKGGVGKSVIAINLAFAFTQLGKQVLLLDADLALENICVLLGLTPQYTIEHLLSGEKNLTEVLVRGPGGMLILPATSGRLELAKLNEKQKGILMSEFDLIAQKIDILLIDNGSGISSNVVYFSTASHESIIIITPEPTSVINAYALIKLLFNRFMKEDFLILVNQASSSREATEVFISVTRVTEKFLGGLSMHYLGFIPFDEKLSLSIQNQKAVLEIYPEASSSKNFMDLAKTISESPIRNNNSQTLEFFSRKYFNAARNRIEKRRSR